MTTPRRLQLEDMLAAAPDDAELRYFYAMELASAGDDAAALAQFRELLAKSPGYVPTYVQAGQLLTRLGQEDEAKRVFRDGISTARRAGDAHAAGEMEAFLDAIS